MQTWPPDAPLLVPQLLITPASALEILVFSIVVGAQVVQRRTDGGSAAGTTFPLVFVCLSNWGGRVLSACPCEDHTEFMTETGKSIAEKEVAQKENKKYLDETEGKLSEDEHTTACHLSHLMPIHGLTWIFSLHILRLYGDAVPVHHLIKHVDGKTSALAQPALTC